MKSLKIINGLKVKNPLPMIDFSIKDQELPSVITLPIYDNIPMVKVGEQVLTTQVLATGDIWTHSSISGEVVSIGDEFIPHPSHLKVPCITIKSDDKDEWIPIEKPKDFRHSSPQELIEKLATSGIAGLGGAGFPTHKKLASLQHCHTIIINACECEPAIEADNAIMLEYPREILRGVEILLHITGAKKVIIAIEDDKTEAFESLMLYNNNSQIEIVLMETKYSSGNEKSLIKAVLGVDIKRKTFSSQYGILMQNVSTVKAIFDFIIDGIPLMSRVITNATINTPQNIMIRIGTHLNEITQAKKLRIGGLMMGLNLTNNNYPILKTHNGVFKQSPNKLQQECIRCGECVKVCPAQLLPQQLYWFAKAENIDKCVGYNIMDCVECRCCDEVCPSNIPLATYFNFAKKTYIHNEKANKRAELSTQRFEFREYRLERNKQEKAVMMAKKREAIKAKMAKITSEKDAEANAETDVTKDAETNKKNTDGENNATR